MTKEEFRIHLLEYYLSTGKVGLTTPESEDEAIDLVEMLVNSYNDKPINITIQELAQKYKHFFD